MPFEFVEAMTHALEVAPVRVPETFSTLIYKGALVLCSWVDECNCFCLVRV